MKPGTEFSYVQVPSHLIPRGWTNDPRDLERCLGWSLRLHENYLNFPKVCTPILRCSYSQYGFDGTWRGDLASAGGRIYLYTHTSDLFRLETSIKLSTLLDTIKEQAHIDVGSEDGMPPEAKLLQHSALHWHLLGNCEWTEKKKADEYERSIEERAKEIWRNTK